jgi:hypothetical protein
MTQPNRLGFDDLDPVTARTFMAADVVITFTGGRRFAEPGERTASMRKGRRG